MRALMCLSEQLRVMLDSFISTQKAGMQKAMRRKFQRFLVLRSDFNDLIMSTLQVGV
jgi:DNA replication licensing factor MCM2